MRYQDYKGQRVTYTDLTPSMRAKAWRSFLAINLNGLYRRPGTIHNRINTGFIRNRRSSLALLRSLENEVARIRSFEANLVEFTVNGEYLNCYLEIA